MTPEQKLKLEQLRVDLIDVLIIEADPKSFPTMDTKEGRGDRQWFKSNAIKTATLAMRIEDLIGRPGWGGNRKPDDDEDGDAGGATAGASEIEQLIANAGNKVERISPSKKKASGKG